MTPENNFDNNFQFESFGEFADWINDLYSNDVESSPASYYASICNNIQRLYEIDEVDGDFVYVYEERLIAAIDLEIIRPELEEWLKEQSEEAILSYIDGSGISDINFNDELQKTWQLFLYWGRMVDGRCPYNGEFLSVFKDDKIQKYLAHNLLRVVKDFVQECLRNQKN
jgi:hypothetical protein